MKKKNNNSNKGFSLIELIIAIAILVILTGLLAPQFMRYMEKARESKDMQALDTVFGAVQTALAEEDAYKDFKDSIGTGKGLVSMAGTGMSLEAIAGKGKTYDANDVSKNKDGVTFCHEIMTTIGATDLDKIWSSKAVATAKNSKGVFVFVDDDLRVTVWIGEARTGSDTKPEDYALNPTTEVAGATTAGVIFHISK